MSAVLESDDHSSGFPTVSFSCDRMMDWWKFDRNGEDDKDMVGW